MKGTRFLALVTSVLAMTLSLGAPATAAPSTTAVSTAAITANLTGDNLAKWQALTDGQRIATARILSDPAYGIPSEAPGLTRKYAGALKVTDTTESTTESTTVALATATVSRTSWVRQNWTILGITYTEVKTTIGYTTSGSVVLDVTRCYGTYVNYVPLRSIDSYSWYTLGNGLADCWTEWTLGIPFQSTRTGYQGLRVNGWGTILKVWYV